jgi:asparagine synthase (glutamine-hydrolysing)
MCGIIVSLSSKKISSDKMLEAGSKLDHRGPDNKGMKSYNINGLYYNFIHTRLSIRGLVVDANQPLISKCGRFLLCFNGEIYNTEQLKRDFSIEEDNTGSDSIVLLHLLIKYNSSIVVKLEGMFAFVFCDLYTGEMIVARDAVGVKQLYKYEDGENLIYSSEISPIELILSKKLEISRLDLLEFMTLGFVCEPRTGFKNIVKLEPSSYHLISADRVVHKRKYDFDLTNCKDISENTIRNIIDKQVISDVPLGVFFSGGMDSTVLAVETDLPLLHLEGNPIDSKYSAKIANLLKNNFSSFPLSDFGERDIFSDARFIADSVEEPISDYTFLASYNLSKKAHMNGYKVMISGMGADEIFGGYPRYRVFSLYLLFRPLLKLLPSKLVSKFKIFPFFRGRRSQRFLSAIMQKSPYWAYASLVGYFSKDELELLWKDNDIDLMDSLPRVWKSLGKVSKSYKNLPSIMDRYGFLSHNLIVADKSSMRAGVELRVPFLAESIFLLKQNISHSLLSPKKIIYDMCKKRIPRKFLKRKKEGFNPPLYKMVKKKCVEDYMAFFRESGVFNILLEDKVHELLSKHFSEFEDNTYKIWQLVFLGAWLERWS